MPDIVSQIIPWKHFTIDNLRSGIIPLWNPYSFSGTNHLANYQSAVLSPFNLIFFFLSFVDAWSILVLLQPLLAGLFMYLFLRSLDRSTYSSVFGSIAFMFCGFIVTWMDYATLGYAILFLPLSLYAIEKYFQSSKSIFLLILFSTIPLSFFSGHFQVSLYFLAFIFVYLLFKYLETKDAKKLFFVLVTMSSGVCLAMPQILPSMEAYSQSLRSTIYQKIEAIPLTYIATFLSPDFFGNPVTRNDWFGHYAEWNGFTGTITLLLAFYSLFYLKTKKILFFLITAVISLAFCLNTPFLDLIVALKIPVLATSAASRIIVLFSFSVIVLAAFGVDYLKEDIAKFKKILSWFIFSLLLILPLWVIVFAKILIPADKILIARQNLILPTLFIVLLSFIVIFSFLIKRIKNKKILILIPCVLVLILSFDMLRFANKWQEFCDKSLFYPALKIDSQLNSMSGINRTFGNLGTEAFLYYKIPFIEGYDAVYIKRYGEFISAAQNGVINESARSVVSLPKSGKFSQQYLNLLGVKYFIHKIADGQNAWVFPFWKDVKNYSLIYNDGVYQVFENKSVMPRVSMVSSYVVQNNDQQLINKILSKNTDLTKTAFLEEDPNVVLGDGNAKARVMSYKSNEVSIKSSSKENSLLVLTDTFYPGWKAYVDGQETKIYRTNFAFRGVVLTKGEHEIVFKYSPFSFKMGVMIAAIGLGIFVALVLLRRRFTYFAKT
jgi:hypothetical protein